MPKSVNTFPLDSKSENCHPQKPKKQKNSYLFCIFDVPQHLGKICSSQHDEGVSVEGPRGAVSEKEERARVDEQITDEEIHQASERWDKKRGVHHIPQRLGIPCHSQTLSCRVITCSHHGLAHLAEGPAPADQEGISCHPTPTVLPAARSKVHNSSLT